MNRLLLVVAIVAMIPVQALAWGSMGHRLMSRAAVKALPREIPDFVRSASAVEMIGELSREPDRTRGAGQPHDADLDPGHFIDLDDEAKAMGGPPLSALPANREDYETALRAAGTTSSKAGWLPYSLMGGYQQLVADFGFWRALRVGERRGKTVADRAWFARDRKLREALILRDLGYWAHFVGDGSQPLHVSIHFNGWGDFPNPRGYTRARIHAPFEGEFVRANVTEADIRGAMRAPRLCGETIQVCTRVYLGETLATVEPLYQLWGQDGFKDGDPRARAFAAERLGAGAAELRDLVVMAWRASADVKVGWPAVSVKAIEDGGSISMDNFYGLD